MMNGVARQFWSEVLDLRSAVPDDDRGRKALRRGRKTSRKALGQGRKPGRTAA